MQATGMGSKAQGALAWRLILGAALLVGQVAAQVQTDGVFPHSPIDKVLLSPHAIYMLPHQDNEAMVAEVVREEAQGSMKPYKFASGVPFEIDISRDGVWSVDPSGTARVWRAKVESPGAITMSLIFSDFYLPPNSELYVSSETVSALVLICDPITPSCALHRAVEGTARRGRTKKGRPALTDTMSLPPCTSRSPLGPLLGRSTTRMTGSSPRSPLRASR